MTQYKASVELAKILRESGYDAEPVSSKYFEAHIKSNRPITTSDQEQIQTKLQFYGQLLGVSAIGADLYRMWGISFETQEELNQYLEKKANTLSHKELGIKMKLFEFHKEAPGELFLLHNGIVLRENIERFLTRTLKKSYGQNCEFIETPICMDPSLWHTSGHMENFKDNMCFTSDKVLKPMNCPCHMLHFNAQTRSYKELPVRIFEYGRVHRNEPSGSMQGLLRMRSFVQDDGHLFCAIHQIKEEVATFIDQTRTIYAKLGFPDIRMILATRPDTRAGNEADWDEAEEALRTFGFEEAAGEGAFYGPKIEMHLQDSVGRYWQCGTIQLDFVLPERMKLTYTDKDGRNKTPVVLHRAILGSIERFMAILLENTQGWLPLWLTPTQVMIIPVKPHHQERAQLLTQRLAGLGIRAIMGTEEGIGKNMHIARTMRIPKAWVIGDKEIDCVTQEDLARGTRSTAADDQVFGELIREVQNSMEEGSHKILSKL